MKYISVVVPEEVDRELRFACADQATTKSRLVRTLIEEYLEEWRKEFSPDLQITKDKPDEEQIVKRLYPDDLSHPFFFV